MKKAPHSAILATFDCARLVTLTTQLSTVCMVVPLKNKQEKKKIGIPQFKICYQC